MADRPGVRVRPAEPDANVRADDDRGILTAAAQALLGVSSETYTHQYKTWQEELWEYTRSVGEYGGVMDWFAAGMSRMHLTAALIKPGPIREPVLLEQGPAVDLMQQLVAGAVSGETQYLYKWGRHLGVPGVGIFVARERDGMRLFDVKSAKQVRRSTRPYTGPDGRIIRDPVTGEAVSGFDVEVAQGRWEQLPLESLVGRIYRPDDEYDYLASSWSRAALTTLREIDLLNRHIVATLLSRLVFNGILFIPEEVTFPVNPQFKDAPDPFIAELVAVASRGIKDPGAPSSALPLPLRVPAQFIEKFRHLILATEVGQYIIQLRDSAISRLATQLPAPPEAMEGKGDQNHWNAWKDSEDNIKLYFGPTMEILCGGVTDIYLHPMLKAAGKPLEQDGGRIVCWYDASDLVQQPDNSQNAISAREEVTINDDAFLTALGMDRDDKVTPEERREQILVKLAVQGLPTPDSFYLLYPEDKPEPGMDSLGNPLPLSPAAGGPAPNAGPAGGGRPAAVKPGAPANGPPAANGQAKAPQPARGG